MGAFLEDGSHEATIAAIHALVVAVPQTTEQLRDYILNFICLETNQCSEKCLMSRRYLSFFKSFAFSVGYQCLLILPFCFLTLMYIFCPRLLNLQPCQLLLQVIWCVGKKEPMHFVRQSVLWMLQVCFIMTYINVSLHTIFKVFFWCSSHDVIILLLISHGCCLSKVSPNLSVVILCTINVKKFYTVTCKYSDTSLFIIFILIKERMRS